eukprot:TRINITY_DN11310_c0_g1_i3.p1 TRINITY_DN11310_c0_g1~~TRINITY_DN11310_c0_g1_i3.p1  ORF type:complete len:844 (+),score=181.87 TRINITY_DN11310_c0_g1_i3:336-2534(+)
MVVNIQQPSLHQVYADWTGQTSLNTPVLGDGFRLQRIENGQVIYNPKPANFTVLRNTSTSVRIQLDNVVDDAKIPTAIETWTIELNESDRFATLDIAGQDTGSSQSPLVHHVGFLATSIYGLFDQGVVQMRDKDNAYFAASSNISRLYALGGNASVDIDLHHDSSSVILLSRATPTSATGLQLLRRGNFTGDYDQWTGPWAKHADNSSGADDSLGQLQPSKPGAQWQSTLKIGFNNRNFPVLSLSNRTDMPDDDVEALLTGLYGSSPGCLCTYPNEVVAGKHVAQIATTIARPDRGYHDTYNYFDPDNFFSLTAMMMTGDPYLLQQARAVFERSGAFLRQNGQLPHHFEKDQPTFIALSGETQTGPNIFWTKTALNYARYSGNITWLKAYMPTLRQAANFGFNLINPDNHMLYAPGSLMIDVFIRNNYTSDSNAMMVGFLREFAEAELLVGNTTGAELLTTMADNMARAVDDLLWASPGRGLGTDDHYITQLNTDNTTRDFVDYDSNLMAVAHRIPSLDRAAKVLTRVDRGRCAAAGGGGPQFVSELYYGKSDTTSGNIGDSYTAMARIAWFDALARRYTNDSNTFEHALLAPLRADLIRYTWLHERYQCAGGQMRNRTEAYFEYPSAVGMMLRQIKYGIDIGLSNVTVCPFGPTAFTYDFGQVYIQYSQNKVEFQVPGEYAKRYQACGLQPGRSYSVAVDGAEQGIARVDSQGVIETEMLATAERVTLVAQ